MKKNARRKHGGYIFDRVGRIIDGLIDNGRLILMIALCLSVTFMVRGLSNLAESGADQSLPVDETAVSEEAAPSDAVAVDASRRIQHRSDHRVELYAKCAGRSYEEENKVECENLNAQVDEAVERYTEKAIKNKTWSRDSGTYLEADSKPAAVAIRTT